MPEGDELALMEALATYGPVAISFDAGHPTFKASSWGVCGMPVASVSGGLQDVKCPRMPCPLSALQFYSDGVYYREDCGNDWDHLNHAVTLLGYGTTPDGEELCYGLLTPPPSHWLAGQLTALLRHCVPASRVGTDYWILRNSWSQLWGSGGYFKMARKVRARGRQSCALPLRAAGKCRAPALTACERCGVHLLCAEERLRRHPGRRRRRRG